MMCSPNWDEFLAALGDDPEFAAAMLQKAPSLLIRFSDWREALATEDYGELGRIAHAARSSMEMLYFPKSDVKNVQEIESYGTSRKTHSSIERQYLVVLCEATERRLKNFQSRLHRWLHKIAEHRECLTIERLKHILEDAD